MKLKSKSLKMNMALNAIKSIMSFVFPLISFPYVSRILGVEQLGKYNFSNSIISYFILFAGLGVAAYARRQGSMFRDDLKKLTTFSNEMFSVNLITTVVSYILLFLCVSGIKSMRAYSSIIYILSLTIILQTIGVEWIYSIFEDYFYITIRSILFQFLSIVMLLLFVHTKEDLTIYTVIIVTANAGSNFLNFFHSRKYIYIKFTKAIDWRKHMPPILIFFATTLSVTVYVSSDTTILGLICGDYYVGLYSVSVKIYTIVKNIMAAIITVTIPRMCYLYGKGDREKFINTAFDIYSTLITIVVPAVIGLILYSKEIIWVIAGEEYAEASMSLVLLSIAILFCLFSYFWGQCILVPLQKEKIALLSAIISAAVNIFLNIKFIPIYRQNAAAFTTVLAESIAMIIGFMSSRKLVKLPSSKKVVKKTIVGCISIVGIYYLNYLYISSNFLRLAIGIPTSCVCYFIIEILLKNETVYSIIDGIKNKIYGKQGNAN